MMLPKQPYDRCRFVAGYRPCLSIWITRYAVIQWQQPWPKGENLGLHCSLWQDGLGALLVRDALSPARNSSGELSCRKLPDYILMKKAG